MKKTTQTVSTPELAVELSNFNFDLQDYEEQKMMVITFNRLNKTDGRTGKSFKYYGVIGDEKKLNFEIFKCKNELQDKGSLAVFGKTGLIQKSIADGLITEEL